MGTGARPNGAVRGKIVRRRELLRRLTAAACRRGGPQRTRLAAVAGVTSACRVAGRRDGAYARAELGVDLEGLARRARGARAAAGRIRRTSAALDRCANGARNQRRAGEAVRAVRASLAAGPRRRAVAPEVATEVRRTTDGV